VEVLPVLPPELRRSCRWNGGRSRRRNLNDCVSPRDNRNNRLKRLLELKAPESSSVTKSGCCRKPSIRLLDNGRRGKAMTGANSAVKVAPFDMNQG